jgi:hypothetical protein
MQLTAARMLEDTRVIGRALLGPLPGFADGDAVRRDALAAEERKRGGGPIYDTWIEYRQGNHKAYTIYHSAGGGVTRKALPAGVDPASVLRIEITSTDRPVIAKLAELEKLVEGLRAGRHVSICGSHESIEFVGTKDELATLAKLIAQIGTASERSFSGTMLQRYAARLKQVLPSDIAAAGADRYFQEVDAVCDEMLQLHEGLGAGGLLTAWWLVYRDACRTLYEDGKTRLRKDQLVLMATNLARPGHMPASDDPASLIDTFAHDIGVRLGIHAFMVQLAEHYLDAGKAIIKSAIDAPSKAVHGAELHRAGPWVMAADRIMKGLLERPSARITPEEHERYVALGKKAEEETVLVASALLFAFKDRTGEKEAAFARDLHDTKLRKGQRAADDLLYQWIEIEYYYPKSYRQALVDHADRLGAPAKP